MIAEGNDGPIWDKSAPARVEPLSVEDEPVRGPRLLPVTWAAVAAATMLLAGALAGHAMTSTGTVTTAPTFTVTASPVGLETAAQLPSPSPETWTVTRTAQVATTQTVTRQVAAVQTVIRDVVVAGPTRTVRIPGPARILVVMVTATVVRRAR